MCRRGYVCRHALPVRRLSTPAGEVLTLGGARHAILSGVDDILDAPLRDAALLLEVAAVCYLSGSPGP